MNDQQGAYRDAEPDAAALLGLSTDCLATHWERWLARLFDLWWEGMLLGVMGGYLLGRSSPAFLRWIDTPGAANMFGFLCIPAALLLDAAIHAVAGNTPGKALLGLRVVQDDGSALGFFQQVWRNLGVWSAGLGLCLPLISIVTMVRQYRRLKSGKAASYDDEGFRVLSRPISWVKGFAFGTGFVLLFALALGLELADRNDQDAARARASGMPFTWTNPETGGIARVSPQWKYTRQTNEDGMLVHEFTQHSGHALVVMASERLGADSLTQYARALTAHLGEDWKVPGGYLEQFHGYPSWTGIGEQDGGEVRMHLRLVKDGDTVWRVMVFQSQPLEYTDALVQELTDKLWNSLEPPGTNAAP